MWYGHASPQKGPDIVVEWAKRNKVPLDIYGFGFGASEPDAEVTIKGTVSDEQRDMALSAHKEFVHFPRYPEPFCYSLMEAWLAGLEVTYAGRVGIDSYEQPWEEVAERSRESEFWKIAEAVL
jgi:LmbE family N-acetylglucosaminyl deacetylase